jgi:hypothetical protein
LLNGEALQCFAVSQGFPPIRFEGQGDLEFTAFMARSAAVPFVWSTVGLIAVRDCDAGRKSRWRKR